MIKLVNTVGFIIVNNRNEILLQRKNVEAPEVKLEPGLLSANKNKDEGAAEEWTLFLRSVEDDEDPRKAIKKNIKKELGGETENCNYFNLYFYPISDNFIKKAIYFFGNVKGDLKSAENGKIKWVDLESETINSLNIPPEQKEVLLDFSNFVQDKFLEKIE